MKSRQRERARDSERERARDSERGRERREQSRVEVSLIKTQAASRINAVS